jgi:hypothetical protein
MSRRDNLEKFDQHPGGCGELDLEAASIGKGGQMDERPRIAQVDKLSVLWSEK